MNRIVFPGNPWPNGHALKELVWSARLVNDEEMRFNLHLVSADYYAEDEESGADEVDETLGDWESKIVWSNFHRCILSSTYWGHNGVLAATRKSPLDFATMGDRVFRLDPLPPPDEPYDRAFGIYLLGHDGVADHEIRISRQGSANRYSLDWKGRIALEYYGDGEFKYTFKARSDALTFAGIQLAEAMTNSEGLKAVDRLVRNLGELKPVEQDGLRWLIPI